MAEKFQKKLALKDCKAKNKVCSNDREIIPKKRLMVRFAKCELSHQFQRSDMECFHGGSREHVPEQLLLQKTRECNFYWEGAGQS